MSEVFVLFMITYFHACATSTFTFKIWVRFMVLLPQVIDTLNHILLYRVHLVWAGFKLTTLLVIGTDCIGSYKSNSHMITRNPNLFQRLMTHSCLGDSHMVVGWLIDYCLTYIKQYLGYIQEQNKFSNRQKTYIEVREWWTNWSMSFQYYWKIWRVG